VTLVHRKLWPAVLAVGAAGEPWQLRGLSSAARAIDVPVSALPWPEAAKST
jgi:hypothetical protein